MDTPKAMTAALPAVETISLQGKSSSHNQSANGK
jgi:hypothetical protein